MSGKVEQTSLITETLLEVVVVQLVALVRRQKQGVGNVENIPFLSDLHLSASGFVFVTGLKRNGSNKMV